MAENPVDDRGSLNQTNENAEQDIVSPDPVDDRGSLNQTNENAEQDIVSPDPVDDRGSLNQTNEDAEQDINSPCLVGKDHDKRKSDGRRRHEEIKLRRLLRFHRYAPVKIKNGCCHFHVVYCVMMLIQIVKIGLITSQVVEFANDRRTFSSVVNRGHMTLRHLLLNKWDSSLETPPYPPAHGDFAVYKVDSLHEDLNYAVEGYYNVQNDAIGFYILANRSGSSDKMSGRMKYFDFPGFHHHNENDGFSIQETEFKVDGVGLTSHFDRINNKTTYTYNISHTFEYLNLTEPVKRLLSIHLDFSLHSVRVYENLKKTLCLFIEGTVKFEDDENNGQMLVDLETSSRSITCSDIYKNETVPDVDRKTGFHPLDIAVLVFCCISLLLSVVFLVFGLIVGWKTKQYMKKHFKEFYDVVLEGDSQDLQTYEYFKLLTILIWDVFVIIADICIIIGFNKLVSAFWATHKSRLLSVFDTTVVLLSIGLLLSWFYIMKFCKLHDNFQVLFKTLYAAFSAVVSYLFCIGVLFTGFFLCGFVVLGPYHVKFETAYATFETLFSISNGDEIFATLDNIDYSKTGNISFVRWFSRVYIYLYVAIYNIVVLNILIAIFVNAYDAIKEEQDTKEKKHRFGPLERALYELFTKTDSGSGSALRSTFDHLIRENSCSTVEENSVKTELRKLWQMTTEDDSTKPLKERTLKTFINEGNDKKAKKCCCKRVVIYSTLSSFD